MKGLHSSFYRSSSQNKKGAAVAAIALAAFFFSLAATSHPALGAVTFSDGDHIKTVARVNIRVAPSTSGAVIATTPKNATGVLRCDLAGSTACPTAANGYNWWFVKWDSANLPSGWSADAYFAPVSTTTAPVIQGISPTYGAPGFPVIISGTNFTGSNSVAFGSLTIANVPSYNGTSLQTAVPAMTTGTVKVSVTNANGTSNQVNFKVTAPAGPPVSVVLSSIDPNGADASWLITNPITLYGSGFTSGGNTVRFSGSYTFGGVGGTPTSITFTMGNPGSNSQSIPYDCWGPGTFSVMVTNANGSSNALPFTITDPGCANPRPANPLSTAGKSNASGQVMSTDVTGKTFLLNVSTVSAGSSLVLSPGAYTVQLTPSTILLDQNGNSTTLENVVIGGKASLNGYFAVSGSSRTVVASQTTIQFSDKPISTPGPGNRPPTTANVGFTGSVASVNTAGSSFQGTVSTVYYLSSQLAAAYFPINGLINVTVPAGATLTDVCGNPVTLAQVPLNAGFDANVSVNLVTNVIMAKAIKFSVGSCTPTISPPYIGTMVPSSGPAGSPVTITGANFLPAENTVNFGAIPIPNVSVLASDPKSIRFMVPENAPAGATAVTVSNANGTSNAVSFTVSARSEINVLSPNGGETLTAGASYTIRWNASTSTASVDIKLHKGTSIAAAVATAVPASQGYYVWTIPQSTAPGNDYTIVISSGTISDSSNGTFAITTESQSRNAFLANFVFFGSNAPKGSIVVNGTINGSPLSGAVTVDFSGPSGSQTNMPLTFSSYNRMKAGAYSFTYKAGGPAGATFRGIKVNGGSPAIPTASGTLADGGTATFTFVFTSP